MEPKNPEQIPNPDQSKDGYRDLHIEGRNTARIVKALSNEFRIQILELLENREMNINSIRKHLGISKTTVLMHLKVLEEAGFISTFYVPGSVGHQKLCKKEYDRLIFNFTPGKGINREPTNYYELNIAPGNYFNFEIYPPCGLAVKESIIIRWDDPSVFFSAERINASILWGTFGFVEYLVPLNIPCEDLGFSKIEITMELSARGNVVGNRMLILPEGMDKDRLTDGVSDIAFWLNGIEIAEHQVMDETKADEHNMGKLTPHWWRGTQYGELVKIEIDHTGTFINGVQKSAVSLDNILPREVLQRNLQMKRLLTSGDSMRFRVGIKEDAAHISGFNIFGKDFGNYPTDISVRFYK